MIEQVNYSHELIRYKKSSFTLFPTRIPLPFVFCSLLILQIISPLLCFAEYQYYPVGDFTAQIHHKLLSTHYGVDHFSLYIHRSYSTEAFQNPALHQLQSHSVRIQLNLNAGLATEKNNLHDIYQHLVEKHPTPFSYTVIENQAMSSNVQETVFFNLLNNKGFFTSNKLYVIKNNSSFGSSYELYLTVYTDIDDLNALDLLKDIDELIPEIELTLDTWLK